MSRSTTSHFITLTTHTFQRKTSQLQGNENSTCLSLSLVPNRTSLCPSGVVYSSQYGGQLDSYACCGAHHNFIVTLPLCYYDVQDCGTLQFQNNNN